MAASPHYMASARSVAKTPLPAVLLVLVDVGIRVDHTENAVPLLRLQLLLC
jgi:hypothetical protein